MPMIAITTNNSIRVNPGLDFSLRILTLFQGKDFLYFLNKICWCPRNQMQHNSPDTNKALQIYIVVPKLPFWDECRRHIAASRPGPTNRSISCSTCTRSKNQVFTINSICVNRCYGSGDYSIISANSH